MDNLPFESIESAQQFITLLIEAVNDSRHEIELHLGQPENNKPARQRDALLLVAHQLSMLSAHLVKSSRILNVLRSLRRLLFAEADQPSKPTAREAVAVPDGIG